ncbi:MAG: hypothetical protein AAB590_02315 [Patescibacteria group bacterium]
MLEAAAKISGVVDNFLGIIRPITGVLVGLALAYFIWGITMFILNSSDEAKRTEAKTNMTWGIIALFVMVSLWGLANLVSNSLQLDTSKPTVDYVKP